MNFWAPILFHFQILGWALIAGYLFGVAAAGRRFVIEARHPLQDRSAMIFWAIVIIILLLLMANRLFNIQLLATLAARCAALDEGWYGERRPFQFLIILLSCAAGAGVALLVFLRRPKWDERLVLFGLIALVVFAAIRSLSFHWIDVYVRMKIFGLNFNGLTEGAALAPVLFGSAIGGDRSRLFARR